MKTKRAHDSVRPVPLLRRRPPNDADSSPPESGIELRHEMKVDISPESESQFWSGIATSMAEGGVLVATYRTLPVGRRVELHIGLPSGPLRVAGVVRWRREPSADVGPGLCVAFDGVEDATLARIEDFCRTREPLYYDEAL